MSASCHACTGVKLHPLLVLTDLAGELITAILSTFGMEKGNVLTQIQYANVTLMTFLRLADKMARENQRPDRNDWKESAIWAWNIHQRFASTAVHYCGSHSYCRFEDWPQSLKREQDAPEVQKYSEQFITIFKCLGKHIKDEDDVLWECHSLHHVLPCFPK